MELFRETFLPQPVGDFINSFGHDKTGAIDLFGQKVTHRPTDGTRHPDDVAAAVHEGELTVDFTDLLSISGAEPFDGFVDRHVEDEIFAGIEQIHKSLDICVACHAGMLQKTCGVPVVCELSHFPPS
jgi:hypothetical protein